MTYRPSPEQAGGQIVALRWVLWRLDHEEWLETPLDENREEPPCPVTGADLPALFDGLAGLVIGARRSLAAQQLGVIDPATVARLTRDTLKDELEAMERAARRGQLRVATDGA